MKFCKTVNLGDSAACAEAKHVTGGHGIEIGTEAVWSWVLAEAL